METDRARGMPEQDGANGSKLFRFGSARRPPRAELVIRLQICCRATPKYRILRAAGQRGSLLRCLGSDREFVDHAVDAFDLFTDGQGPRMRGRIRYCAAQGDDVILHVHLDVTSLEFDLAGQVSLDPRG